MIDSFFWRKLLVRSGVARLLPSVRHALGGSEVVLPRLTDRLLSLPLAALRDSALLPEINTPDSIHLAHGTPRFDLAVRLPRLIHDRPAEPWGDPELRAELADHFHRQHGVDVNPAQDVLITHGATGAFASIIDAFVNPGDQVVLFDPCSPMFSIGLQHRRACITWVKTTSRDGEVQFDMAQFQRAMRGAKLLILADPCNPTGCVFASEDLEQIAFWAMKYDCIIVQDVSFDRWRATPPASRLANLPHTTGRLLSIGSFAKSHGLSAVRVGWLIGQRRLVQACAMAGLMNAPFVSSLCQQVALDTLQTADEPTITANIARRTAFERLSAMRLTVWPARGGFFHWVEVPTTESGRDFAQRLLSQTGVLVNPGNVFGPSGTRFVRISHAIADGQVREGFNRLQSFLNGEPLLTRPQYEST